MPTLRDVAESAGVSPSTASRALANSSLVNEQTRQRIHTVAKALGYLPNRAARSLITGRTGNLGLLVPDLANPYFSVIAKSVQEWAQRRELSVLIADSDEQCRKEQDLIRLLAQQVDGLVLCSPRSEDKLLRWACFDRPAVLINRRVANFGSVSFDNHQGIHLALSHLASLGHRRIAWVPGPRGSRSSEERTSALAELAPSMGIRVDTLDGRPPTFDGGRGAVEDICCSQTTAVVAYNDLVALGLLGRLAAIGMVVPDQYSVVGIDDISMSEMTHPPLTTVASGKHEASRMAVEMLEGVLSGRQPCEVTLPVSLVVRGSTGPATQAWQGDLSSTTRR